MSKHKDRDRSEDPNAPVAGTRGVGVYDEPASSAGNGAPPGKVGIYDRPNGADHTSMSPVLIALGAAAVIGIPLLIWAF
jgi:hypothetical protein